jgi:hypothetical protein
MEGELFDIRGARKNPKLKDRKKVDAEWLEKAKILMKKKRVVS